MTYSVIGQMKEERQPLQGCPLCHGISPRDTQMSLGGHQSHVSSLFRKETVFETLGRVSSFTPAEKFEGILELKLGMQICVDLRNDGKNIKSMLSIEIGISESCL